MKSREIRTSEKVDKRTEMHRVRLPCLTFLQFRCECANPESDPQRGEGPADGCASLPPRVGLWACALALRCLWQRVLRAPSSPPTGPPSQVHSLMHSSS